MSAENSVAEKVFSRRLWRCIAGLGPTWPYLGQPQPHCSGLLISLHLCYMKCSPSSLVSFANCS